MQTAQAQSGLNRDTAVSQNLINMTNQVNPWGSVTYNQTGNTGYVDSSGKWVSVPQFTQTTAYSPEQQGIFDRTTQAQTNIADIAAQQSGALKDYLSSRFDFGQGQFNPQGVTQPDQFSFGGDPFSFNNQDAANWAFDLGSQRIIPQQERDRASLETQLVNKGIRPGSDAWNSEMERLGRTQGDQLNQLALTGRQQAYNEALTGRQNNFGEALSTQQQNAGQSLAAEQARFAQELAARQQQFQEAVTGRNQPLNEITALLSGSQIANPGTASSPTPQSAVGGVDYSGLVQSNYQNQLARSQAGLGGLFGLAGSLGGAIGQAGGIGSFFSDARLKTGIRRIGYLDNGLPVYAYRYIWGGPVQIGVMAQEAEQISPEAVGEAMGFKTVDYGRVA
ncbi:MAG: tail fiber domain-containing protein [Sphingobium sp.]|nr:tail fiber domain-containing protein [Sphingobium sp.]